MEVTEKNPHEVNTHEGVVFDRSLQTAPEWLREKIASDLHDDATVLDVGCGTGALISLFKERTGAEIHGLDFDEDTVEAAHRHGEIDVNVADAANLPYQSNTFDVVYCIELIEHVPEAEKFVKEVERVLKPGGVFWIKTPNLWAHDLFHLASGNLDRARHFHVSLFTHSKMDTALDSFDVSYFRSGMMEYQKEKLSAISPVLGTLVETFPFKKLPRSCQPSIVVRGVLTP